MNILYLVKKKRGNNWSDVLDKQFAWLENAMPGRIFKYEIDTSSLRRYLSNTKKVFKFIEEHNIEKVHCNHIVCSYPFFWGLFFYRKLGKKLQKTIALHESEPILGLKFWFKHRKVYGIRKLLVFLKLYHYLPLKAFDKILVLNNRQKLFKKFSNKYIQLNYLGITLETLNQPSESKKRRTVGLFFPNDPQRPEKGFSLLEKALENCTIDYTLTKGGGIPYPKMKECYLANDIVVLSGYYETYSLVLLEGMSYNKYILTSSEIGLIENLLEKYSKEDLKRWGIFVVDFNTTAVNQCLIEIKKLLDQGIEANTYSFLIDNDLMADSTNRLLASVF